jgi:hypothetical protein
MGRIAGKPHEKKRKYLTEEEKALLVARNAAAFEAGEFLKQVTLAEEFGISQVAVSKILRQAGARTRTPSEACPTVVPVLEAARIYLEHPQMRLYDIAELYNVGWQAVRDQFNKVGIPLRSSKDYAKYVCDRNFFTEVDPVRAYFAGFIAADGYVTTSGRSVNFGIHPKDVEIFHNLKKAAGLDQPVVIRPNNLGKLYAWLTVCSVDWVRDLKRHYNIVNAKSLILEPPNLKDEKLIWHFLRGYFDGDGHAGKAGDRINFVSGSPKFFAWILELCGTPGHIQQCRWWTEEKGDYLCAQSAFYATKETVKRLTFLLYKDSTPANRLERKYLRLVRHLV